MAEELYNGGYISYPRTETEKFSRETDLQTLITEQREHPAWGAYASALQDQPDKFLFPREGVKDDQAHPPIHPTKRATPAELGNNRDSLNIYELVVRHFLACCSCDARGRKTQVKVDMGGEEFRATGLVIEDRAWLDVYNNWERWHASTLPAHVLEVGALFVPTTLTLEAGRTQPPPLLSEADLIGEMDRKGIGTDATIAQHIKTILDRKYVTKTEPEQRFQPTNLGLALVEGYDSMGYAVRGLLLYPPTHPTLAYNTSFQPPPSPLSSHPPTHLSTSQMSTPGLRAMMEAECKKVARGELARGVMVQQCLVRMKQCFDDCDGQWGRLVEAVGRYFRLLGQGQGAEVQQRGFSKCGRCQGMMDLRRDGQALLLNCPTCQEMHLLPPTRRGPYTPTRHNPPTHCPLCSFEALLITPEGDQAPRPYSICPYCFHHPPPNASVDSEFRCSHCVAAPQCTLARGVQDAEKAVLVCKGKGKQ